jgi:hypothetical protein
MSRKFLKSATYSVHKLFVNAEDLSYKSRYDYRKNVISMVKALHAEGVQISDIRHLKQRHIERLVSKWNNDELNPRTIKNRLAQLRYVCHKINKSQIMTANNDTYLPEKIVHEFKNKAIYDIDLNKIPNPYVQNSLKLQQAFGLRREESIKLIPSIADKGDKLYLQASWTKGGIARYIPIRTEEQRQILNQLNSFLPRGASLIPEDKSYIQQENAYVAAARQAGFSNLHGLRYAYAQRRYAELTAQLSGGNGWVCPYQGGLPKYMMSHEQKAIDNQARLTVSNELGHSRIEITKKYIG